MKKVIENKTVTPVTVTLTTLRVEVDTLMKDSVKLNNTGRSFAKNALAIISDMIVIYPTLKDAKDYAEFQDIFGNLLYAEDSITENHIKAIFDVKTILNINDVEAKAKWYGVLAKLNDTKATLKMWQNVVKSFDDVVKGKKLHPDFDYIAKVENVLTQDMPKNTEILMPEKRKGQLYPTAKQIEEMKPTAKKTISFGREAKKLGSKIGGMLKQFDKQEISIDTKEQIIGYITENLSDLLDGYLDEKAGKDKKVTPKKDELIKIIDEKDRKIESLQAALAIKVRKTA